MDCTGRFESKERTMYSINRIKTAAATLTVGVLLVFALATTAQAGGGGPQRLTAQQVKNVRARADAMDRYYRLGQYSSAAVALQAERRFAQAVDRYYRLGRYAVIKTPSPFQWADAGIGAGAMLGAIMLVAGLTAVVSRRRIGKPGFPSMS